MSLSFLGALTGLALIDSTSIGTVGVPIILVIARVPVRKLLIYLATITIFYFALGVLVLLGVTSFLDAFSSTMESTAAYVIQLLIGIGLFALSFRFDPKRRKNKPERAWLPPRTSDGAFIGLALTAGILEIATMLPYIAAIGILTQSDVSSLGQVAILAGYTVVMVVPALLLILIASFAGSRFDAFLERVGAWIRKNADGMVGWALGIVGFLLAANAIGALFGGS
jgi:hypothetical protein